MNATNATTYTGGKAKDAARPVYVTGVAVVNRLHNPKGTFSMNGYNGISFAALQANAIAIDGAAMTDAANVKAGKEAAKAILANAKVEAQAARAVAGSAMALLHDAFTVDAFTALCAMGAAKRKVTVETAKASGFGYSERTDKAKATWRKYQQHLLAVCDAANTLPSEIVEGLSLPSGFPGACTVTAAFNWLEAPAKAEKKALRAVEAAETAEARVEIAAEEKARDMIATGAINASALFTVGEMLEHILGVLTDDAAIAALSDGDAARVLMLRDVLNDRFPVTAVPDGQRKRRAA